MEQILFYVFSIGAILSGFMVISATNPIHSVFGLILAFANTSFILLILEIEFLAFLFLIVYIGAIAILFLFVVMMLDIRLVEIFENATRYIPIGFIVGIMFILELTIIIDEEEQGDKLSLSWVYCQNSEHFAPNFGSFLLKTWEEDYTNIQWLGNILYTDGFYYFLISSIILLIAMIGAIVLTLYHESEVKRQDLFTQLSTEFNETIRLRKNVIK